MMGKLPDFETLCAHAEVRGLAIGLKASRKVEGQGTNEQRRRLDSIVILKGRHSLGEIAVHRSLEAAARRALEVITK